MDLIVALEHRFARTPDGAVWSTTNFTAPFWTRYLEVFDRVHVLARMQGVAAVGLGHARVDGERVHAAPVPYYVGPRQYLLRKRAVGRAVRDALAAQPDAAVVLRVPGTIGSVAARWLRRWNRPFGVEVVGDPFEVFAPGVVKHPLRAWFRWESPRLLRRHCAAAAAALYVTREALQRRYPASSSARAFSASDAELADDAFVDRARGRDAPAGPPLRLVTVGTLDQLYKSPDVLIRAVARCRAMGVPVELAVVGDGRFRPALERLARELGVASQVRFAGHLPAGGAVRRELDAAHVFVLPSRTKGMPRALLEAMARGLPCLATPVGGVPELLPPAALVLADAEAIARRVRDLANDPAARVRMSGQNLARARHFHDRVLGPVREAFYLQLRGETARRAGRHGALRRSSTYEGDRSRPKAARA